MDVFSGTYEHTLDDKGRVIVPASFREDLEEGLVLTRGQDHCIEVYPHAVFEQRVQELRRGSREDRRFRQFLRVFLSGARQEQLDSQGRVTVPQELRQYAGLNRELAVIGNLDRIELWDRGTWQDYLDDAEPTFADLDTPFDL